MKSPSLFGIGWLCLLTTCAMARAGDDQSVRASEGISEMQGFQHADQMVPTVTVRDGDTALDHALGVLGAGDGGVIPPLPFKERLGLATDQLANGLTSPFRSGREYVSGLWSQLDSPDGKQSGVKASGSDTLTAAASAPSNGLTWSSPGYAFAQSNLASTYRQSTYALSNGPAWYDMVKITAPQSSLSMAESISTLKFDKNNYLQFDTWASPQNYQYATAFMMTTTQPTTFSYIYFYVRPYYSSDYGKPVTIELTGSAIRSAYRQDGQTANSMTVYANYQLWASERYYGTLSTKTFPKITINTTFGAWVPIAMSATSYAIKGNSASQQLKIGIQVR